MRKKVLSILLALALCLSLLPTAALASDEDSSISIYVGGTELEVDAPYYNNELTGGITTEGNGEANVKLTYHADAGYTLTLNGVSITKGYSVTTGDGSGIYGIYAEEGLSLVLEGTNTIDMSGCDIADLSGGVNVRGDLTISGSGILTVTSNTAAVSSRAVYVNGDLTIDGCTVDIDSVGAGIWAGGSVIISNGARMYIEAGYGIEVVKNMRIIGSTLNITAEDGIYACEGDVTIADSSVTIQAEKDGICAVAGSVNIECTQVTLNKYGPGLVGTAVSITADNYGIYADKDLAISSKLTISSPEGGEVKGIGDVTDPDYCTIVDQESCPAKSVAIEPLTYKVTFVIQGLSWTPGADVPAGQSLNETYCEFYGVEDFSEILNTDKEGYTFVGFYTEDGSKFSFDDKVTADVTITAKWTENTAVIPVVVVPTYPPVVEDTESGEVSVSDTTPIQGQTVTITPEPEEGKVVESVTVTDSKGNEIEVVDNGDGTYSFVQPAGKVTITVIFKDAVHVCPSEAYSDLNTELWYHEAVDYALSKGLMNGVGGDVFTPGATASRAMIVTILWRLEGEPTCGQGKSGTFSDVPDYVWYTEAVEWAAAQGIVNGYGDSQQSFGPEDPITREQLAAILYRYEQVKGGGFTGSWMFLLDCTDRDQVSGWAYEAMCWMNMNGVITGDGSGALAPKDSATRAQAAQILMNYLEPGND